MKLNTKLFALTALSLACSLPFSAHAEVIVGSDLNSNAGANADINALFSGNRGSNGGGDQSLQFGDQLAGTSEADVLIGGLGIDVLFGYEGDDIIVGGTEDFNPANRDRAFGHAGNDIFIWAPGDGNDFFDGGDGIDVVIFALLGEERDSQGQTSASPVFQVSPPGTEGSRDFDGIALDENGLPSIVIDGPGFCELIDQNSPAPDGSNQRLSDLNIDHLARFTLIGPANNFDNALAADPNIPPESLDSGLRIAVHMKNTEFVVCGARADGAPFEIFDLRSSPVEKTSMDQLPANAFDFIQAQSQIIN